MSILLRRGAEEPNYCLDGSLEIMFYACRHKENTPLRTDAERDSTSGTIKLLHCSHGVSWKGQGQTPEELFKVVADFRKDAQVDIVLSSRIHVLSFRHPQGALAERIRRAKVRFAHATLRSSRRSLVIKCKLKFRCCRWWPVDLRLGSAVA